VTDDGLGDCYKAAWEAIGRFSDRSGWALCHGTVTGTGGEVLGEDYGHAWIEGDGWVIDESNGADRAVPRDVYYRVGNVRDVTRYKPTEAAAVALRHSTYGPWED
jgi:hypothetical protein